MFLKVDESNDRFAPCYHLYSLDSNAPQFPKEQVSDLDHPRVLVDLALSDGQCVRTTYVRSVRFTV